MEFARREFDRLFVFRHVGEEALPDPLPLAQRRMFRPPAGHASVDVLAVRRQRSREVAASEGGVKALHKAHIGVPHGCIS
jgi:hypothetical protein